MNSKDQDHFGPLQKLSHNLAGTLRDRFARFAISLILFSSILYGGSMAMAQSKPQPPHPDPFYVYVTFPKKDTATAITINAYRRLQKGHRYVEVLFDTISRAGDPTSYRYQAVGKSKRIPKTPRTVYSVDLHNLKAATTYYYVVGDPVRGYSPEHRVTTLPSDNSKISMIAGGDMATWESTRAIMTQAAKTDPDVALIGGDIAYANGEAKDYALWDEWLKNWQTIMRTSDGRDIPLIVALGNHEVNDVWPYSNPLEAAPYYFIIFPQDKAGRSFFARKLGSQTIVYVLDTNHVTPHFGAQRRWLRRNLEKFKSLPNQLALYHIPLYPSKRSFFLGDAWMGRLAWAPLFDQYRLDVAFENHDHTFKRSKLIYDNEVATGKGTLYVGDGSFGKAGSIPDPKRWYVEKVKTTLHFWQASIDLLGIHLKAYDEIPTLLDQVHVPID